MCSATCREVHTPAGLRADNSDMLLPGAVLGMLKQIASELRLLLLEPFELGANIGQAIGGVSVQEIIYRSCLQIAPPVVQF